MVDCYPGLGVCVHACAYTFSVHCVCACVCCSVCVCVCAQLSNRLSASKMN